MDTLENDVAAELTIYLHFLTFRLTLQKIILPVENSKKNIFVLKPLKKKEMFNLAV